MQVDIRGRNVHLSESLLRHAEERLRRALDRVVDRIASVRMQLEDINGPKGGLDKRCLLHLRLANGGEVTIQQKDGSLYRAINLAVGRLQGTLRERLRRLREHRARH
ncbi:MAG: ribosome-associated translation inhibitor RaiA [Planctomycetota bacterium]